MNKLYSPLDPRLGDLVIEAPDFQSPLFNVTHAHELPQHVGVVAHVYSPCYDSTLQYHIEVQMLDGKVKKSKSGEWLSFVQAKEFCQNYLHQQDELQKDLEKLSEKIVATHEIELTENDQKSPDLD